MVETIPGQSCQQCGAEIATPLNASVSHVSSGENVIVTGVCPVCRAEVEVLARDSSRV